MTAHAADAVPYMAWDETTKTVKSVDGGCTEYTVVNSSNTTWAEGWYVVGTSLRDAVPMSGIAARDKMVFVVGNEHFGVSEEVLQETDVNCRIEMENNDSLNVAVAAGILLHRFRI